MLICVGANCQRMMGSLDMIFGIGVRSLLPGDDELLPFYNRHLLQSRLAKSPVVWVLYSLIVDFGCTLRPARGRSYNDCNIILFDWNKPAIFALIGQAKLPGCLPEEEEEEEEYVVYSTVLCSRTSI